MKRRRALRCGFSLMEVLLGIGILLASLIVLGSLAVVGRRHAESAAALTDAQVICQTKLNEILIGAAPLAPVERQAVEGMDGWVYSVEVESQDRFGMVTLRVTASQVPSDQDASWEESPGPKFMLTRWMHAPDRTGSGVQGVFRQEASPLESVRMGESLR